MRQQHAVAGALYQRQPRQRLQVAELKRDRGLGEMKLLGRRGDGPVLVHGRQRAQLTDSQFPQKPSGHRSIHYKKIFGLVKDNKISLIRQIAFL